MAMGRSWPSNSHREKLLSFLAEDRASVQTLAGGLDAKPFRSSFILWLLLMKKPLAFSRSQYLMEICLLEGKLFKWLTEFLARRLFCSQDTATCAHKLKWHSLAAPNSSLSQGILWHERGTTKYCLSKIERSWEFKRKYSCQLILFKTWIRIKISSRQVKLPQLQDARWCFWLRDVFSAVNTTSFPWRTNK